jgi:hypothetical protein
MSLRTPPEGLSFGPLSKIHMLSMILERYRTVLHPVSAYAIFRRRMDNLAIDVFSSDFSVIG